MNITNIISTILLSIYSIATFSGIGIYNCNCTHTKRLVLMFVQPSCQCETTAGHCCSHDHQQCSDEHHDKEVDGHDDCCFPVPQNIDIDQLTVVKQFDIQEKVLSLFFSSSVLTNDFISGINACFTVFKNHSPPTLLKIPIIYLQSQLRL